MIIESKATGKDFEPDAALDTSRDYDLRIQGLIHTGTMQKDVWVDGKKTSDVVNEESCIVLFELVEEDTHVDRGPEDNTHKEPRTTVKFMKYSSHEKSNLFSVASAANKKAAWVEGKQGKIDVAQLLGSPINATFKEANAEGKQYLDKLTAIPEKYKKDVDPSTLPVFCYSVMSGAGEGTSIEDVPTWLLNYSLNKAVNAEEFGMLEEIEAHLEKLEQEKDGKLDGDDKPADEPAKKEEAPKEEEAKPAAKKRTRKTKPKAEEELDFSTMSDTELEELFMTKGGTEEALDSINDNLSEEASDEDYKAAVIEAIKAL